MSYAALLTLIVVPLVLLGGLFRCPLRWLEALVQLWAHLIVKSARVKVVIHGLENLPAAPAVLVGNHQGVFEILALLGYMPRPPVFVAKQELFKIPLFGWGMRAVGHIPVDRSNRERAIQSIQTGTQSLTRNQQNVVFFPEGTRARDGQLGEFKKGAFVLAIEAGFPIVPMSVQGSYDILPPKVYVVTPGTVYLTLLPAIETHHYTLEDRDHLIHLAHTRIQKALDEGKSSG